MHPPSKVTLSEKSIKLTFFDISIMIYMLPLLYWHQEGGDRMAELISFILSIMAKVIAYYVCKWFDRVLSGNEPKSGQN